VISRSGVGIYTNYYTLTFTFYLYNSVFLSACMLRAGIVLAGVCVSVRVFVFCQSARLSAQNLKNYRSEIDRNMSHGER